MKSNYSDFAIYSRLGIQHHYGPNPPLGGGEQLRAMFEEFSQKSSKYSAMESEKLWVSLQYDSYQVTVGTMVHYLRAEGAELNKAEQKAMIKWMQRDQLHGQHDQRIIA